MLPISSIYRILTVRLAVPMQTRMDKFGWFYRHILKSGLDSLVLFVGQPTYSLFPNDHSQDSHSCICQVHAKETASNNHHDGTLVMPIPEGSVGLPLIAGHPTNERISLSPRLDPAANERNQQFARLVAGVESATGEVPPPYAR